MNDQLAFGSSASIKAYMSIYDNIVNYVCARVCNPMRPETLLKYHLSKNNIHLNTIAYKYYILRGNGSILIPEGKSQKNVNDRRLVVGHL